MNPKIYFDNGSTSWPKAPQVASSMSELLESGAFNINRGNSDQRSPETRRSRTGQQLGT